MGRDQERSGDQPEPGEPVLRDLKRFLEAPKPHRDELVRATLTRRDLHDLAQLLAMADTDRIVRLPNVR